MKLEQVNSYTSVVLLIAVLGFAPLCLAQKTDDKTSIKEVKQETEELIQALKSYSADQRDAAVHKTKAALDSLDKRIDALETRIDNNWDKMNETAREKARASLKSLHQQRVQVAELFGRLKSSSDEAWDHMEKDFSKAYSAINDAWEKVEIEYEPDK